MERAAIFRGFASIGGATLTTGLWLFGITFRSMRSGWSKSIGRQSSRGEDDRKYVIYMVSTDMGMCHCQSVDFCNLVRLSMSYAPTLPYSRKGTKKREGKITMLMLVSRDSSTTRRPFTKSSMPLDCRRCHVRRRRESRIPHPGASQWPNTFCVARCSNSALYLR